MCLTKTIDCIVFENLTEEQLGKFTEIKERLLQRKAALEAALASGQLDVPATQTELRHVDEGLSALGEILDC